MEPIVRHQIQDEMEENGICNKTFFSFGFCSSFEGSIQKKEKSVLLSFEAQETEQRPRKKSKSQQQKNQFGREK